MAQVSVVSACGAPVIIDTSAGSDYTLPEASIGAIGGVKQVVPVEDVQTIPVTDIQSAQDAIAAMGTTLSELMQAMRASGILAVQD